VAASESEGTSGQRRDVNPAAARSSESNQMTLDERLSLLAERHLALFETVELNGHQIQDLNTAIEKQSDNIDRLVTASVRIANAVETHEARIEKLEDRET